MTLLILRPTAAPAQEAGPSPMLTVKQAAALMGMSRTTVIRKADAGELPCVVVSHGARKKMRRVPRAADRGASHAGRHQRPRGPPGVHGPMARLDRHAVARMKGWIQNCLRARCSLVRAVSHSHVECLNKTCTETVCPAVSQAVSAAYEDLMQGL